MTVRDAETLGLKCLDGLKKIRAGADDPAQFWPLFLDTLKDASGAEAGLIGVRVGGDGAAWQPLAVRPEGLAASGMARTLLARLNDAAAACAETGGALIELDDRRVAAVALETGVEGRRCLALLSLGRGPVESAVESLQRLRSLNDIPVVVQRARSARESAERQEQLTGVLDLISNVNACDRFLSAAMTFCNELASRFQCERAALGWLKNGSVRLKALSHTDDFVKKAGAVERLELAMEEAFDQDVEISVPAAQNAKTISRDHQVLAAQAESGHAVSLPLRKDGRVAGVCTLERRARAFDERELRFLRLACDQTVRRLDELHRWDRWFGARWAERFRPTFEEWLGYQHTWAKAGIVLGSLLIGFACFVPVPYRLEAPAILRSEDVTHLAAPFDGFIEQVGVRPGEAVAVGQELLRLDRNELFLEEAGLLAEVNRYRRESEKARAGNALADMRIADALADQADARLATVRYRLGRAVVQSPFAGIVAEGDLRERLGAPVRQGDILFRIGRTDRVEVEAEVRESDIHDLRTSAHGQIALAGRPGEKFKIRVVSVEPVAVAKKDGNVFRVRCAFVEGFPVWARPGMTGLAKLRAGHRTLLYIFLHRAMDLVRLKLWW